jgi:hypothetical protein
MQLSKYPKMKSSVRNIFDACCWVGYPSLGMLISVGVTKHVSQGILTCDITPHMNCNPLYYYNNSS